VCLFPYISGRPSFHLRDVFSISDKQESVFPLYQKRCYFFFSARYALASGVEALGISTDDTVLLPSYNCGVEIDPILRLGIRPVYYKIGKDLLVDLDDLLNKITSRVKAILVTHFLGFPQPIDQIKKICVERNLFLIEDCAHAFLSANNEHHLGSYGDIAIFSLLKTLPVPNGGVLILNNDSLNCRTKSVKPSLFSTIFYAAELLKYKTWGTNRSIKVNLIKFLYDGSYISLSFIRFLLAGLRKYFNPKGLYLVKPDSYLFVEALRSWGISDLSKRIINKTNYEEVKFIRRKNFEYLLNYFLKNDRVILPFTKLPSGVCPLFFPIIVENTKERESLYTSLKKKKVITHPWWDRFHPAVPWADFPDAVYLKQRLFGLPIHQDLTLNDLDYVLHEFANVTSRR